NTASTNDSNATTIDSPRNCPINCTRIDPTDLRIPTSFARFSDLAVDKFIKLIHASNRTNNHMTPNIHTYTMTPPKFFTLKKKLYKCQRLIGCNNTTDLSVNP